jgi:phosphatidate cytidylyltransferase
MLKLRVITGTLLAAGALLAITLLPAPALALVLALVMLLACWEWSDLAALENRLRRSAYCSVAACAIAGLLGWTQLLGALPNLDATRTVLIVAALWWCVALGLVKTFPGSAPIWRSVAVRLLMGLLALLPAWLALVYLRALPHGEWKIVFLLGLVAAADIGAYFSGKAFGRRKLAPAVSPGKSWEGFWGGLAFSMLLALAVWWFSWRALPLQAWLLVVACTVLASVLGDLLESMVKRQRGVKDSGKLLPGHGGVLDRLDSISAAAPIFALGLLLAQ